MDQQVPRLTHSLRSSFRADQPRQDENAVYHRSKRLGPRQISPPEAVCGHVLQEPGQGHSQPGCGDQRGDAMIETDGQKQFEQETTEGTRQYHGFRVVFHPWLNSHKRLWLTLFCSLLSDCWFGFRVSS